MAGTRWAYVRAFEQPDTILPHTYMVVRLDGNSFHRFSSQHDFTKPNDPRALELMNAAASRVMHSLRGDALLAFGESDEYSFLLAKQSQLYSRRQAKIITHIVSMFTAAYVHLWPLYFPHSPLDNIAALPSFDARLVVYPTAKEVRDYFAWRQADTHINNLYNTAFWTLIQHDGISEQEAHKQLEKTVSADKHDILFKRGINYNDELAMFRKGSILLWHSPTDATPSTLPPKVDAHPEGTQPPQPIEATSDPPSAPSTGQRRLTKAEKKALIPRRAKELRTMHIDLIGDAFWSVPGSVPSTDPAPTNLVTEVLQDQPWLDPARVDRLVTAHGLLD